MLLRLLSLVSLLSSTATAFVLLRLRADHKQRRYQRIPTIEEKACERLFSGPLKLIRSRPQRRQRPRSFRLPAPLAGVLSDYFENDLVSVRHRGEERLCVVTPRATAAPLCTHADDNPTDLYLDPQSPDDLDINDQDVVKCYGEGWYSQRVVPSLGGGPGYGAEADPVWSVEEEVMERLEVDGVVVPVLDLGIAHGEKARGGAI